MKRTNSRGFTIVEAILVVVVLAFIGGVGYIAYSNVMLKKENSASDMKVASSDSNQQLKTQLDTKLTAAKKLPTPTVKNKDDLQKGIDALNDQSAFDTKEQTEKLNELGAKFLN